MKIQIASDLHLEFLEDRFPGYRIVEPTDADVLVIAGDIHRATRAIAAFADWPVPVVYVHGNHELYHEQADEVIEKLRAASADSNVHFLERDACLLNGVRFLGCSHPKSIHPRYAGSLLNAGFASDLTPLVERADLWIHGHVHDSFDYEVAGTRVVANPRGYAGNRLAVRSPGELEWENEKFDTGLVVEVE